MAEWTAETVENCLARLSFGALTKLQTRDYKPAGQYPIIDQGQSFIAGWTDDDSGLISSDLPVIVFGDHTRALKFVDFPFVRGADGTQVLKPRDGVDPLFFYYACRSIDLPSRGYNRHFSILKEKSIPIPPPHEQCEIGAVMRQVENILWAQADLLSNVVGLKRAVMRELFTRGLRNEAQKDTEIGSVPESWGLSTLSEIASIERGRFLYRPRNEPRFYGGATPFVQTGDVVRSAGRIREFTQTLNADGVAISRVFPAGTILITIAANIGYTGVLQFDAACPDSLVAIIPNPDVDALFLEYFLQTQQSEMDRRAPKGTQKNINIQFLNPWLVPLPTLHEQHEIVAVLDIIDCKIDLHKRKRAVLSDLFKALLHKLITGEIRTADLDLSVLKLDAAREAAA